jgi:LCP family protein required for cell wall assembly
VLTAPFVFSFLRRFAIALVAVSAITAGVFVSANAYGKNEFEKSRTIPIDTRVLKAVKPGQPANYLMLGSDVRPANETAAEKAAYGSTADAAGQRSDVMMILHVDPAGKTGRLVSFPRDMIVTIPGHGKNLLNAAYSLGGPSLVIQTLEVNFPPLQINHYLEVDFRGFKDVVNAIGHINLYFPTPVHDPYTGLNIDAKGCVSVNGDQALAYARSREYFIPDDLENPAPWQWDYDPKFYDTHSKNTPRGGQGWHNDPLEDLDRIPRQQYFLRTLSQTAIHKTGSNILQINSLLNNAFKSLAHDQNLKYGELTSLAYTFRDLDPGKINMATIPWTTDPSDGNRVIPKYPDWVAVANGLQNFTPPKKPIVKPLETDKVTVRVVNGSGVKNAGSDALNEFTSVGFKSAGPAQDADKSDYKTQILYAPGKFEQGYTVALATGTLDLVPAATAKQTLGGDALLIVGTDYGSLKHGFAKVPKPENLPSTTTTQPSVTTSTSSTTTTVPASAADPHYVPVDPKTGGTLVGCPSS